MIEWIFNGDADDFPSPLCDPESHMSHWACCTTALAKAPGAIPVHTTEPRTGRQIRRYYILILCHTVPNHSAINKGSSGDVIDPTPS